MNFRVRVVFDDAAMPLKITKEMSSHLVKFIRTVDVAFNREFLVHLFNVR